MSRSRQKEKNVRVWRDTKRLCKSLGLDEPEQGILFDVSTLENEFYDQEPRDCVVDVIDEDTLVAAKMLYDEGHNDIMIQNMASEYKPGGGVRSGCFAQEEELSRRSNLVFTLPLEYYRPTGYKGRNNGLRRYDVIYSPEVTVLKDEENLQYDEHFNVAVYTAAAPRKPKIKNGQYKSKNDLEETNLKIRGAFIMAINNQHRSVVFGALGCGAYGNPVREVAKLYSKALDDFAVYFDRIIFAIKVCRPSDHENLDTFSQELREWI